MTMSRMLGAGNPHLAASLSCTFQRVVERHCLEHENYVSDPREASIFIGCKGLFYKVVVCNDPFVLLLLFDPPLTPKKKTPQTILSCSMVTPPFTHSSNRKNGAPVSLWSILRLCINRSTLFQPFKSMTRWSSRWVLQ